MLSSFLTAVLTEVYAFDFPKDADQGQLPEGPGRGVVVEGLHDVVVMVSYMMSDGRTFLQM